MQQSTGMTFCSSSVCRLMAVLCVSFFVIDSALGAIFLPTADEMKGLVASSATVLHSATQVDLSQLPRQMYLGRSYVMVGDMLIADSDIAPNGAARGNLWTGGNVYYVFDAAVTASHRNAWTDAAATWNTGNHVRFFEGTGNGNYIYVQNSDVNNSAIGMAGQQQIMNIVSWNSEYTIAHEIGHALGLIHEHQRSDRNSYVTINSANVQSAFAGNFPTLTATIYGAYDFDSVMHYDKCAFSIDCPPGGGYCGCTNYTITVLPPNTGQWQDSIGQRSHLSLLDQSAIAQRYGGTPSPTPTPCGTALSQNFDGVTAPALPASWVATNISGDATMWVTSATAPDTAPNDAFIPDQNGISDKRLDTPSIAITSASAQLSFRNNFNTEFDGVTYWDGGVLEVSSPNINGGAFTDITNPAVGGSFVTGGYTGAIDGTAGNPLAGRMAWSGNSGGYINTVVNLGPNVNGQTIHLRFRFGTDEATSAPGWRIDTISITGGGGCSSPTPSPTTTLGNISTRLRVDTGSNVMIGGFIVSGTQPKSVIVRALGPSLAALGAPGALANPTLELRDGSGALLVSNNDWQENGTQAAIVAAAGLAPSSSLESAIAATLPAGNSAYTAIVRGFNGGTGVGVVEVHDANRTVNSKLANISTRGFVNTGDNVMIGGMILAGNSSTRVLIRAIGPSLANFGVPNALPDPMIELRDASGTVLASNDDWYRDQQAEILATGLAPADNLESAIVRSLVPGAYTMIVREFHNLTGVAVVEAYQLP